MLFSFLLGAGAGAGGYWYFVEGGGRGELEHARNAVTVQAGKARESFKETLDDFSVSNITHELTHGGTVVREKARAAGQSIADTTANTRTTAAIKTRLLGEPGLSALAIHVDATDGIVTLSGKVDSAEQVSRAVKLALETEGVTKVISTLQVSSVRQP